MHAHTAAQRPGDYCIRDKNDLESWRDLCIVWLAMVGWITAGALMSFQLACIFQHAAPDPAGLLGFHVRAERLTLPRVNEEMAIRKLIRSFL